MSDTVRFEVFFSLSLSVPVCLSGCLLVSLTAPVCLSGCLLVPVSVFMCLCV